MPASSSGRWTSARTAWSSRGRTAEQLEQAVKFATYPPEGVRGIGAERATCWGQCFTQHTKRPMTMCWSCRSSSRSRADATSRPCSQVDGRRDFLFRSGRLFLHGRLSGTVGRAGRGQGNAGDQGCRARGRQILRHHRYQQRGPCERRQQGFRMLGLGIGRGLMLRSSARRAGRRGPGSEHRPRLPTGARPAAGHADGSPA